MSDPVWTVATALKAGDVIDISSRAQEGEIATVEDFRPISREWPMTVAVQVGGAWRSLPAEAYYLRGVE